MAPKQTGMSSPFSSPSNKEKRPEPTKAETYMFYSVLKNLKTKPDVDWDQVAVDNNFKNADTAKVRYGQIKRKLGFDLGSPRPVARAGPITTPRKRAAAKEKAAKKPRAKRAKRAKKDKRDARPDDDSASSKRDDDYQGDEEDDSDAGKRKKKVKVEHSDEGEIMMSSALFLAETSPDAVKREDGSDAEYDMTDARFMPLSPSRSTRFGCNTSRIRAAIGSHQYPAHSFATTEEVANESMTTLAQEDRARLDWTNTPYFNGALTRHASPSVHGRMRAIDRPIDRVIDPVRNQPQVDGTWDFHTDSVPEPDFSWAESDDLVMFGNLPSGNDSTLGDGDERAFL